MKKVTAFKLSDGTLVESEAEAKNKERQIAFNKAVNAFAEEHGTYEGKAAIKSAISGNAEQLYKILNAYFK